MGMRSEMGISSRFRNPDWRLCSEGVMLWMEICEVPNRERRFQIGTVTENDQRYYYQPLMKAVPVWHST